MHPTAKRTLLRALLAFCAVLVVLVALVPTITVLNNRQVNRKKGEDGVAFIAIEDESEAFLGVSVAHVGLDPLTGNSRFAVQFAPGGPLANSRGKTTQNVTIDLNGRVIRVNADSFIANQEIVASVEAGDPDRYPFDEYLSGITIGVTSNGAALPVFSEFYATLNGWNPTPAIVDESDADETNHIFVMVSKRSATAIGFSIFTAVLQWSLAIAILILTLAFIFIPGGEAPPLPVYVTMLFALPAVRMTQPGVPPIGCTMDLIAFFWCMAIIAISTIVSLALATMKKWGSFTASLEKS
jgi:hypothetical protein